MDEACFYIYTYFYKLHKNTIFNLTGITHLGSEIKYINLFKLIGIILTDQFKKMNKNSRNKNG